MLLYYQIVVNMCRVGLDLGVVELMCTHLSTLHLLGWPWLLLDFALECWWVFHRKIITIGHHTTRWLRVVKLVLRSLLLVLYLRKSPEIFLKLDLGCLSTLINRWVHLLIRWRIVGELLFGPLSRWEGTFRLLPLLGLLFRGPGGAICIQFIVCFEVFLQLQGWVDEPRLLLIDFVA